MAVKELHNEVLVVDPTVEPVPVEPPAASLPPPPKRALPPQGPLPPLGAKPEPPSDKMDTTPDPAPAPAPPPPPRPAPAPPRAPPSDPSSDPIPIEIDRDPRQIHITAHQVPVIYQHILDEVPTMHTRPPTFKHMPELTPEIPAPEKGYDFVLHVGVAGRGPLRVERRGHKIGYLMKDITGELPPIVAKAELTDQEKVELAMAQRHRAANNLDEKEAKVAEVPNRGFGVGYEKMPAELETDINVPKLIHYIKESGMDVRINHPLDQTNSNLCANRKFTRRWTLATISVISSTTVLSPKPSVQWPPLQILLITLKLPTARDQQRSFSCMSLLSVSL